MKNVLRNLIAGLSLFALVAVPVVASAAKGPQISAAYARRMISKALHKKAGMNFQVSKPVRVVKLKLNPNRFASKGRIGFTATIKQADGSTYRAKGLVGMNRSGSLRGLGRVLVQTGTPVTAGHVK